MARRHSLEILFEQEALKAGFDVQQPRSIRIDEPVENSGGKKGKVVTTPDFFVVNPDNGLGTHVEIANGTGANEHKAAQRRVVKQARVENYVQVTGYEVTAIQEASTVEEKKLLLLQILYGLTNAE